MEVVKAVLCDALLRSKQHADDRTFPCPCGVEVSLGKVVTFMPNRIHTCLPNKRNETGKLLHRVGSVAHFNSNLGKSVSGVEVVADVVLLLDAKPSCFGFQSMLLLGIITRRFIPRQEATHATVDGWSLLFVRWHHLGPIQADSWPMRSLLDPAAIAEERFAAHGTHPGRARATHITGVALRRSVVTGNRCLWTLHVVLGGCLGHCSAGLVEVEDECAKFLGCGYGLRGALSGVEADDEFSDRGTDTREENKSDNNGQEQCVKEIKPL